jgi:hypothetical protein
VNTLISFGKQDIGAEILPILTSGLYRDTFDTLREYIQNSIDAQSEHIRLEIDPDVISIRDDGSGMTAPAARRAIRLGISDKNPLDHVGFRGIGVYSAFNLCDRLTIYSRTLGDDYEHVLRFDFARMRNDLISEAERRKQDLPSSLHLEGLLNSTVSATVSEPTMIRSHGTLAVMSGLLTDVYERLMDWEQVRQYLENVVPLPFNPDFRFKEEIEERLETESTRIVPLTLKINAREEPLYRPYTNDIFSNGGRYSPKFVEVNGGGERFGLAWVCINDARKVLPNKRLRGILIKKFEFSIATRDFLEPFFGRTVYNRRITGELIVQHPDLIPNAARSDFEPNAGICSINRGRATPAARSARVGEPERGRR